MRNLVWLVSLLAMIAPGGASEVGAHNVYQEDNSKPARAYWGSDYYDHARAVCHISVPFGEGTGSATGFLVGPDLIMTNRHVISSEQDATEAVFRFDYEDAYGNLPKGETKRYDGAELLYVEPFGGYDMALVRMTDQDWPSTRAWLELRREPPQANAVIYIPQHPLGKRKRIAVESDDPKDNDPEVNPWLIPGTEGLGHLLTYDGNLANGGSYRVDTDNGSSGSPVILADTHQVAVLHASGGNGGPWIHELVPLIRRFLPPRSSGEIWIDNDDGWVPCEGTITIGCHDADLLGAGTVAVQLTSDTGDSETLVLQEQAPGRFSAEITIAIAETAIGDGVLQTAYLQRIVASYTDVDDGSGEPATATSDAVADARNRWFKADNVSLSQLRLLFTPDPDNRNAYVTTLERISVLPWPAGGRDYDLGASDEGARIDLSRPLQIYGQEVESVWMFRNGHLSLDRHSPVYGRKRFWEAPRIGVFASSLYQTATTRTTVQEMDDRVVFTWYHMHTNIFVDDLGQDTNSDFQLEWFHDGRIAINLGHIAHKARATIGLGLGRGEPLGFQAEDYAAWYQGTEGPVILQQPDAVEAQPGTRITLRVRALGATPLSYQWFRDGNPVDNATEDSHQLLTTMAIDGQQWQVQITDADGSITSETVVLNVVPERKLRNVIIDGYHWERSPDHGWGWFGDQSETDWLWEHLFGSRDYWLRLTPEDDS